MEHIFNSESFDFQTKASFSMPNVRIGFARKVFSLLGVQLLTTFVLVSAILSNYTLQSFLLYHTEFMWISLIISIVSLLAMSFSKTWRKTYPNNYIALTVFTLTESLLVGYICCMYEISDVLLAFGITAATTIGLAAYALLSKQEVSLHKLWPLFAVYSFLNLFLLFTWSSYSLLHFIYSIVGCVVYSCYLVLDIQRIVSGRRGAVSIDDYVYGAVSIYLDIINLFIKILKIIDKLKNENERGRRQDNRSRRL